MIFSIADISGFIIRGNFQADFKKTVQQPRFF